MRTHSHAEFVSNVAFQKSHTWSHCIYLAIWNLKAKLKVDDLSKAPVEIMMEVFYALYYF